VPGGLLTDLYELNMASSRACGTGPHAISCGGPLIAQQVREMDGVRRLPVFSRGTSWPDRAPRMLGPAGCREPADEQSHRNPA